jgi:hypothetical protein
LRNLIAANVSARLDALTGGPAIGAAAGQPLVSPSIRGAARRPMPMPGARLIRSELARPLLSSVFGTLCFGSKA